MVRGRPRPRSSADPRTSAPPSIRRCRRRTPWGSSRGSGIGSARSPSTSRSTSRRRRRDGRHGIGVEHRRRRGPDAAGRFGRRGRRRGDVRPLAAGTRARCQRRRRSACRPHSRRARPPSGCRSRPSSPRSRTRRSARRSSWIRTTNQLFLYDGFDLEKSYHVATAAAGYVTPPGRVDDHRQAREPDLDEPRPDTWGADLPAFIPPGPGNPLGTRALYLDAPGSGSTERMT